MELFKFWLATIIFIGPHFKAHSQNQISMKSIDAKGLRTTIYKVDDLQEAKSWYAKAFGKEPYFDESFYVGFDIGGYELGLLPEETPRPKTTNVLSYWGVEDITDAYDKMITNGAKELETPNDVGDGIKVALVKDPWDNVIGLIYNPYFKPNEELEQSVVEWAPFTLKNGVSESDLLILSKKLQVEFLVKQEGFIRRELIRKSENEWVDLVYWKNKILAEKAMKAAEQNEVCGEYFNLMDMEQATGSLEHFDVVNIY